MRVCVWRCRASLGAPRNLCHTRVPLALRRSRLVQQAVLPYHPPRLLPLSTHRDRAGVKELSGPRGTILGHS